MHMRPLMLIQSIFLVFEATLTERLQTSSGATGNQVTRSVEFALGENSSSGATDQPATSYFLRPSPSATGFQASGSLQKINGQSPSGVVLTLLSPVNVDRETASSLKVTKSSNHAGFQTDANFSAFVQRSSPTSGVLDLSAGSSASLQTASLPSRARGVQTTGESIVQIPGIVAMFTPGEPSTAGEPLPLLAKILIPVFGVLLVVVVGVAWCCCVRGKERENFENLIIESTLMVRLDVTENRRVSC
nr:uncharacterized protein LOC131778269 isoform X2 [Pocillopora verrucosa]